MMEATKKASKYRLDIIFILAAIALSLLLFSIVTLTRKEGAVAVVEIDGVTVSEHPLSANGVFPLNEGTNVLVIENGVAYLNYSSCPDHICEKTGKIRYVGQSIVCLPNRVAVTICGDLDGGVDLVG